MPDPSANRPPLTVGHVITRLDKGGSSDNTLLTALLHDRSLYTPWIVSGPSADPTGALESRARQAGVRFIPLRFLGRAIHPARDLLALLELIRLFRARRFDIVHTHTSKAGILGRIAARIAGIPRVVHTPHGHVFWGYYGPLFTRLFMAAERFCGRFSRALVALTEEEKADYARLNIEPLKKIRVIPSGVELVRYRGADRSAARTRLGLAPETFAPVTVARFEPVKNHAVLLDAASILKSEGPVFQWTFLGDGPGLADFRRAVHSRGLDQNVTFAGWRSDIPDLLPAFDCFVLCSLNEGMGRVFVEAQAAGLPVVASDICGIRSVVQNGATGFLHSPRDAASVAASMLRLGRDSGLRGTMSRAAREHITSRFDAETMVRDIERLYLELGLNR